MEFDRAVAELDALISTLERDRDERALLTLELVDAIHRPALARIAAGDLEHPIVRALLAMYDLSDVDDEVLVEEALDQVRPYIESHGGALELLAVRDGVVHVRMSGSCHGCAASTMTLRRGIEAALRERYPQFREVVAHEPQPEPAIATAGPALLQVKNARELRRPKFVGIDTGLLRRDRVTVHEIDGIAVLLVDVEGELYAFRNRCPVDDRPLDGGRLAGAVLVCPWHNCAYDARTGKRLDDEGDGLAVVPIAVDGGEVRVAVNVL